MKKAVLIVVLALLVAVPLFVLAGCGGKKEAETTEKGAETTSDLEKLVDNAMRQYYQGNPQPMVDLISPDLRDQYGELFTQGMTEGATLTETHYRTEQVDATHANVYFWGTLEIEVNGQKQTETLTEAEAQALPMVKKDGQWYIDMDAMMQRMQQQMQQSSGTSGTSVQTTP
jgi:hypothetical protein